jgi:hypothetical protein
MKEQNWSNVYVVSSIVVCVDSGESPQCMLYRPSSAHVNRQYSGFKKL